MILYTENTQNPINVFKITTYNFLLSHHTAICFHYNTNYTQNAKILSMFSNIFEKQLKHSKYSKFHFVIYQNLYTYTYIYTYIYIEIYIFTYIYIYTITIFIVWGGSPVSYCYIRARVAGRHI